MKILLIEDEQPAARQLTRLIHEYDPSFVVVDTLDSVEGAVSWLKTFPAPDLIFMDIQIADGLSFDIFTRISVASLQADAPLKYFSLHLAMTSGRPVSGTQCTIAPSRVSFFYRN